MNKNGFSLIELMVTLVVVAVITAAMLPVITKKLTASSVTIKQGNVTEQTSDITSSCTIADCTLCNSSGCLVCSKTCAINQKLNVASCTCSSCASNCALCESATCIKCSSGYYLNGTSCTSCPSGYFCDGSETKIKCSDTWEGCNTCTNTACSACDTTNYTLKDGKCESIYRDITSQGDCTPLFSVYISSAYTGNKGICVLKYNSLDLPLIDGSAAANTGTSTTSGCIKSSGYCENSTWTYSSCARYVCNWNSANSNCNNLNINGQDNWRLPTNAEGKYFYHFSNALGNNGLMVCGNGTEVTKSEVCNYGSGNSSYPHYIWMSDKTIWRLDTGRWFTSGFASSSGMLSYRCVIDKLKK